MNATKRFFVVPYLKGVGQIMLQDNPWTGLLFLIGIFLDSPIIGLAAVLSVMAGTLTAKILKYPEDNINSGLYGFSATLVGVALTTFFKPVLVIWIAIVVGSALATALQHFFISRKIPGYTFPFILVTWLLAYIFWHVYIVSPPEPMTTPVTAWLSNQYTITSHGFGEVIFQASIVAGILFFLGVFVASPVAALYGLAASVFSASVAVYMNEPSGDVSGGMFSFNAVLCAITFAGTKQKDGLFVLASIIFALVIEVAMINLSATPYLTFPFVGACWIVLAIKKILPPTIL